MNIKTSKRAKPNKEILQSVNVDLKEEQLQLVAGGIVDDDSNWGCTKFRKLPDIILLPTPSDYESL